MIKFGTSGWRAILADEFTFENVRRVSDAIARVVTDSGLSDRGVAIGYDTRFLSETFAEQAAGVLTSHGIRCVMSVKALPTPTVSHAIRNNRFAGAINITASHNPYDYNGIKFSTSNGAPSPPDVTKAIETYCAEAAGSDAPPSRRPDPDLLETVDFSDPYFNQLETLVRFDPLRDAGITVALDPRWGAARGHFDAILQRNRIPYRIINDKRDVTYGGEGPDVSARNLEALGRMVVSEGCTIGLACDGDADRFGVVDADGTWIPPNLLLALLADYLAETRGFRQGLGRTYATTALIDAVARHYGVPLRQTPVGFKYLGEFILEDSVFLAGEESAGMSVAGHLPEKDGLLAGLLAAEMVATRGRTLMQMREDLFAKVGPMYSARDDFQVSDEEKARLRERMENPPDRVGRWKVSSPTVIDGLRLDFEDGSWLLMRPSGTEPVVRYYVEAPSEEALADLKKAGRAELIGGAR